MRKSNWTPSIVPNENDQTVYLVADDFGKPGRAWVEADYETTDLGPRLHGQGGHGWSRTVSSQIRNQLDTVVSPKSKLTKPIRKLKATWVRAVAHG